MSAVSRCLPRILRAMLRQRRGPNVSLFKRKRSAPVDPGPKHAVSIHYALSDEQHGTVEERAAIFALEERLEALDQLPGPWRTRRQRDGKASDPHAREQRIELTRHARLVSQPWSCQTWNRPFAPPSRAAPCNGTRPVRSCHASPESPLHRRHRHHQLGLLTPGGRARPRPDRPQPRRQHSDRPLPDGVRVLRADIRRRRSGPRGARRPRVRRRRRLAGLHPGPRARRPRPVRGPRRAVRLHQLGLGLPDAAGAAARDRVDAAAQPVTGSTPATRSPARTCSSRPTASGASR